MGHRAPGEGSIIQRADGRWQASIQIDGRRRTVYGKTRQEASAKLDALKRQASDAGAVAMPGKRCVNDLLDAWLVTKQPTLKPRTFSDYAKIADTYIRLPLGSVALARLSPDRIARMYARWQTAGKARTALKVHRVLSAALSMAVRWAWLASNPADRVDAPRYAPPRREVWSTVELATFLQGIAGQDNEALWLTALGSGCRLGELLALLWSDVDLETGSLSVTKSVQRIGGERIVSTPKTPAGVRKIILPKAVVAALKAYRAQQATHRLGMGASWQGGDLVFTGASGGPLCSSVVQHALRRACERIGVPALTVHDLRHQSASVLLSLGVSVADLARRLGHSSPAVTLRVYSHAVGQDQQAADAMDQVMGDTAATRRR